MMNKEDKNSNKQVIKSLDRLNKTLGGDIKIVKPSRFIHYFVALSFVFGFSTLAFGIGLQNDWDVLIAIGFTLIFLAFFLTWVLSETNK